MAYAFAHEESSPDADESDGTSSSPRPRPRVRAKRRARYSSWESTLRKPYVPPERPDDDEEPEYAYVFKPREYRKYWKRRGIAEFSPPRSHKHNPYNYIEVKFEDGKAAASIRIYETFDPCFVLRIMVFNLYKNRFDVLWSGKPVRSPNGYCAFVPPIKHPNYPIEIVQVDTDKGTSGYNDRWGGTPTSDFRKPTVLPSSDALQFRLDPPIYPPKYRWDELPVHKLSITSPESEETEGQSRVDHFNTLSNEVIWHIFSFLDVISLSKAARVSRRCRDIAFDPLFYQDMNLKPFWHLITSQIFVSLLKPRMEMCTKLDLSRCGGFDITGSSFVCYIQERGDRLTSLKLNDVKFVFDLGVSAILKYCYNLEELELQKITRTEPSAHSPKIEECRTKLKRLDISDANVHWLFLKQILECNPKLEYLGLGQFENMNIINFPLYQTICSLKHLKILDLYRCSQVTQEQVTKIIDSCPLLEDLDIGWCCRFVHSENQGLIDALARSGKNIKRLDLGGFKRLDACYLQKLADSCSKMEVLILAGIEYITPKGIQIFLMRSKNLKSIDISIPSIHFSYVQSWITQFPRVEIKQFNSGLPKEELDSQFFRKMRERKPYSFVPREVSLPDDDFYFDEPM